MSILGRRDGLVEDGKFIPGGHYALEAELLEADVWIPPLGDGTVQQIVFSTRRRRVVGGGDLEPVVLLGCGLVACLALSQFCRPCRCADVGEACYAIEF